MNLIETWEKKYEFLAFDNIDSTHLEARRIAKTNNTHDFVLIAKSQKNGCGRHNRQWISSEGNLFCSMLLQRQIPKDVMLELHFVAALAVKQAIVECGVKKNLVQLKWPNDIMLNNKKCAGILLESVLSPHTHISKSVIISVGVNCLNKPEIDDNISSYHPTCLKEQGYPKITADHLLHALIPSIEKYYLLWLDKGFEFIRTEWLKSAFNLEHAITIHYKEERLSGIFKSIDDKGNLELELEGGYRVKINSGEVIDQINYK